MKLCYRGVSYERGLPCLEFADGAISGKYRGVEWRSRQLLTSLVLHSVQALTYRGVAYLSSTYRFASPDSRNMPRSYEGAMS
ncbi:MAG TPA: DUF4278 domain-containing protein [Elainellaceae cyanobacterium]